MFLWELLLQTQFIKINKAANIAQKLQSHFLMGVFATELEKMATTIAGPIRLQSHVLMGVVATRELLH